MKAPTAIAGHVRTFSRRFRKTGDSFVDLIVAPVAMRAMGAGWSRYFGYLPSLPSFLKRRTSPRFGAWDPWRRSVPEALRSYAGVRRDPVGEADAYASGLVRSFEINFPEALEWIYKANWRAFFLGLPRLERRPRLRKLRGSSRTETRRWSEDGEALTRQVKEYAGQLGLSAVGVAEYDPKYTFEEFRSPRECHRVVVCILEENFDAAQTIPSVLYDRMNVRCSIELDRRTAALAELLRSWGYRADMAATAASESFVIPYAVQAGLGQLGLNGQLLTPVSGSRCRIKLVSTDAPLALDSPVDYGIPSICDRCRACVRRCPGKALTARRRMHRGVEKAKIDPARCVPVLVAAHDCAICTKVCPIQRYGLAAVLDEYERTGRILGRQTDELEGFDWPLDGRHYGPGEKPSVPKEFFEQPELARLRKFQSEARAERRGHTSDSSAPE